MRLKTLLLGLAFGILTANTFAQSNYPNINTSYPILNTTQSSVSYIQKGRKSSTTIYMTGSNVVSTLPHNDLAEQCLTSQRHKKELLNPAYRAAYESARAQNLQIRESWANTKAPAVIYTIPVVFHIIHKGEPVGTGTNISDAQIQSSITAMNRDFQRLAGDGGISQGAGVDTQIEFCLAQRDPNGNAHSGINRVNGTSVTNYASQGIINSNEVAVKALSIWPNTDYLNIWVVAEIDNNGADVANVNSFTGGTIGYAYSPTNPVTFNANKDGVVILNVSTGNDPSNSLGYRLWPATLAGRTMTHEIGHFLALNHMFENTTSCTETSCSTQGDNICDTPPTMSGNTCAVPTCPGTQVENYMDYTEETCKNMFTAGQANVAQATMAGTRLSLGQSIACNAVNALDASISAVIAPTGTYCGTVVTPQITILNLGSTSLTSADILYNVDGVGTQTFSWTNATGLANTNSENITLSNITVTGGAHTFNVTITNPNGGIDGNTTNDVITGTAFTSTIGNSVNLTIYTDNWGYETAWEVKNSATTTVASGGNPLSPPGGTSATTVTDPGAYASNVTITENLCLADGCYDLTMFDDFGDGISTNVPQYTLIDDQGNVLVNKTTFTATSGLPSATDNFCVPYTVTSVTVDFVANATNIPVNSSILYTDLTTGTPPPSSWTWALAGAIPIAPTTQNPIAFYNTVGTYNSALTADNGQGTVTNTKPNYITVYNPTGGFCDTLHNLLTGENPTSFTLGAGNGFLPGHNANLFSKYGDKMTATTQGAVQKLVFPVFRADAGNAASSVTFNVWADNAGLPGVSLASQNVLISNLNAGAYNTVVFATPPIVNGVFYVGVEINYGVGDTVIFGMAPNRTTAANNTAYVYSAGTWKDMAPLFTGGLNSSFDFQAFLSDGKAVPSFTTSATTICQGDSVFLDASASTNAADYFWDLNGDFQFNASGQTLWVPYLSGTYNVKLFTRGGCFWDSTAFTGIQVNGVSTTVTPTNMSCNGVNDGSATATSSGTGATYTYLWDAAAANQTGATAAGLIAGAYSVTTTSNQGCTTVTSVTITEPSVLTVTATGTNITTSGGNDGTITAVPTGGTTAYNYAWSPAPAAGQTVITANNLTAGVYCVTVTDAGGCTTSACVTLTEPATLNITTTSANANCGLGDGTATASVVSGGIAPFTYLWDTMAASQATATATGLLAGTYSVTVTGSGGLTSNTTITVGNTANTVIVTASSTDESCGDGTGTATATASGGAGGFTYAWNNSTNTSAITNLSAGTFTVTATDAIGCFASATTTVTNVTGGFTLNSITGTDELCGNGAGSVITSVSGGTMPYTYNWSNTAQTTGNLSNLSANTYAVTITESGGCRVNGSVTVSNNPGNLSVTVNTVDASCGTTNGSANAVVTGGTGSIGYTWSSSGSGNGVSNLGANNYSVTVSDANSCTVVSSFTINSLTGPTVNASGTNLSCNGANDGTLSANATGGVTPLNYVWSNGSFSSTVNGVAASNYTVTVTDGSGCAITSSTVITEPAIINVNVSVTNTTCGNADGTATVSATGGAGGFSYSWSNGQGNVATISNLAASTFTVTVTDANSCANTGSANVANSSGFSATANATDVSCNGLNDGTVTAIPTGGSPPYTYIWSTGTGTGSVINGLGANTYIVTVTDATLCTVVVSTVVNQPNSIVLTTNTTAETCGDATGTAAINATGGSGSYSYLWSNGSISNLQSNLGSGVYFITVTDGSLCTATTSASVIDDGGLTITVTPATVSICEGDTTTLIASSTGNVTGYAWSTGTLGATASVTTAGNYSVTVTDVQGCKAVGASSVSVIPQQATTLVASNTNVCPGDAVTLVAGGGAPYLWAEFPNEIGSTVIANPTSGGTPVIYSVTSSSNGCSNTTATVTINFNLGTLKAVACSDKTHVLKGESILFTAFGKSNPAFGCTEDSQIGGLNNNQGIIEWDFNGDGIFTANTKNPVSNTFNTEGVFIVAMKATKIGVVCSAIDTIEVTVGPFVNTTSVETLGLVNSLQFYPNPTRGSLNINFELQTSENIEIRIYNSIGEVVYFKGENAVQTGVYDVDMNNLAGGLYFLNVKTESEVITKRISLVK